MQFQPMAKRGCKVGFVPNLHRGKAHQVARLFKLTESPSFVKTKDGTNTQKMSWLKACLARPSRIPCQESKTWPYVESYDAKVYYKEEASIHNCVHVIMAVIAASCHPAGAEFQYFLQRSGRLALRNGWGATATIFDLWAFWQCQETLTAASHLIQWPGLLDLQTTPAFF